MNLVTSLVGLSSLVPELLRCRVEACEPVRAVQHMCLVGTYLAVILFTVLVQRTYIRSNVQRVLRGPTGSKDD